MDELITKQMEISEQINKNYNNYRKSSKERLTKFFIETRSQNLEVLWEKFMTTHFDIVCLVKGTEKSKSHYFASDVYSMVEETYCLFKSRLKEDMEIRMAPSASSSKSLGNTMPSISEVKLPRIQLPSFSGLYEEWQHYYDMFLSLIHNNASLSAVQKLHYLKSSLTGEPEALLRNLSIEEANYDEAFEKLKRRYNNKRYNSNEILKRLFSQRSITAESPIAVKQLLDTTSSCIKSLKNLGIKSDSWDVFIIYLVVSKLDYESRRQWETELSRSNSDNLPTWDQLVIFLEMRFRTLEMLEGTKHCNRQVSNTNPKNVSTKKSFHSKLDEEKKEKIKPCLFCSSQHLLYQCKQFGSKSPQERSEFVQSKGLCYNCLSPSHSVRSCHQATCCRRCGRRHHTLLHFEREQQPVATTSSSTGLDPENIIVAHFAKDDHNTEVLLATALVKAVSTNGYSQIVRVLIDQGSEASFISENIVQTLGLKKIPMNGIVSGVGDSQSRTKSMVTFRVQSLHNSEFSVTVQAFVLSSLTSFLPSNQSCITNWPEIQHLPLADPKYGSPGKIDIILGVDIHSMIIMDGLLKHPSQTGPIAQNTKLGWILSGKISNLDTTNPRVVNLHMQVREDQLLKQFWEIEREPDMIGKKLTKEEIRCEEIFETTTVRTSEGRYKVRLPFNKSIPECIYGKSREIAQRRFQLLERRLQKNLILKEEYSKAIEDYIEQNHAEVIECQSEINNPFAVYLPHHAVVKEEKETTKVRVVFDASCKGVNNISLNDTLLVGPRLQQDLRHILLRWRLHTYCIVADLKQMYRQVLVGEQDADFQRILWRSNPSQPIQHLRLSRLTFGTACAPYLAVKSLQQLAKDESAKYPLAAKITLEDYYVDDLLTGGDSEDEAIEVYNQMNELMRCGGFQLQKWCTNSSKLCNHIMQDKQRRNQSFIFKDNNIVKVLGISWKKASDNFEYTYNSLDSDNQQINKRKVLSDIARLYDPMGWISPVIVVAKIFIQKLWKAGLSWDDTLPSDLLHEWCKFKSELTKIKGVSIPRWMGTTREHLLQLHVFVDASQRAYGAVVYLKAQLGDDVQIKLVTAKTKVAPVEKEISIPRLELCAALLGTKLIHEVSQVLNIPKERLHAWSDSTVVLAWLSSEPSRWTTFVSNRVSEILTVLDRDQWHHVRTEQNPADCASRGLSVEDLINHKLWFTGPDLLQENVSIRAETSFMTNEEVRHVKTLAAVVQLKEEFIWTRFSNLQKLLRVLSYCKRFLKFKLPKEQRVTDNTITATEMKAILQTCIKMTQELHFAEELQQLKSQGYVTKRSSLHTLSPFLDMNGTLRVGGRIKQSHEDFNKKHPVILPSDSHITRLIISDAHQQTLHGGPQLMLNYLRAKFWILRARDRVKKCYRECVICTRYSRRDVNQYMGQLPERRLTPDRPFKSSGVDFTGHINVRFSPGRGSRSYKGYVCLFICMVTRAIHLEAVSDLTANGFIAAFRRFVARRGHCQHLYSDNGTNFVGANKELQTMVKRAQTQAPHEVAQLLANEGTTWHFIPPHAPNFGGLWEAGGKSAKSHMKKVIGDSTLTYEELSTVLAQVEACLNSRPISCLSDHPDDPLPLTPGHFLVGEPLITIPDDNYLNVSQLTGLQRWKLTQRMLNDFWKKWSDEYLVNLNQRFKWSMKRSEPQINDIVVVRETNMPPAKWLLGRVVEKHPGKDSITRVVTIKTKNGLCKRPCNRLCLLLHSDTTV